MATNRIEEYLEAILAKIADGTDTTVPAPAWRIEEYLAAIYSALSSGGGGGGVLVVNVNSNGNTHTLNKTFAEILEAFTNTGVVLVKKYQGKSYQIVINTYADDEFSEYSVFINGDEGMENFTTNTRTGYPVYVYTA